LLVRRQVGSAAGGRKTSVAIGHLDAPTGYVTETDMVLLKDRFGVIAKRLV